ncbi:uncharacterized protein SCHCODRAFT_02720240, partial [Schizophyllum commune H4-8]|uniref:uncharacterized protein n=1 Tax=Schizophyllum commune (strain H4-8 / FGSC 9210) TaxID=578458 RepID=UPI002160AE84
LSSPTSEYAVHIFVDSEPPEARAAFFADSRPPEACARSLVEGRGRGMSSSPFVIMNWWIFANPEPQEASAGSNGEVCGGVRAPPALNELKERCCSCAGPKPPEACAGALGEGYERGGASVTPSSCIAQAPSADDAEGICCPYPSRGVRKRVPRSHARMAW